MDTLLVVGRLPVLDRETRKSLENSGFSVVSTLQPDEAVSICQRTDPVLTFVEVDPPEHDNFDLLPQLRHAVEDRGRIVAVCNRYSDGLDDYCECHGADFALPQVDSETDFNLFVRGLISLIPVSTTKPETVVCK